VHPDIKIISFAANALQCIVNGEENPQIAPSALDFVTLPKKDRATAIGNMHKKLVKTTHVVPEISSRIDTQTNILITIPRHRCGGRSNKSETYKKDG